MQGGLRMITLKGAIQKIQYCDSTIIISYIVAIIFSPTAETIYRIISVEYMYKLKIIFLHKAIS